MKLHERAMVAELPLKYASAAIVAFMMLSVLYDIVTRWLGAPTIWVTDLAEYSLVYLTFLPAAGILLRDGHVKVELLMMALSPRWRAITGFAADIFGLIYCAVLCWFGATFSYDAFSRGYTFSTAWGMAQAPIYIIIPIGAALLMTAYVVRLVSRWRGEFEDASVIPEV